MKSKSKDIQAITDEMPKLMAEWARMLGDDLRITRKAFGIVLPLVNQQHIEKLLAELYDLREDKKLRENPKLQKLIEDVHKITKSEVSSK